MYESYTYLLTRKKLVDAMLANRLNRISVLYSVYAVCGRVDTAVTEETRGYINNLSSLSFG